MSGGHSSTGPAATCMACSDADILAPLRLCSDCRGAPDSRERQVEEDASAGNGKSSMSGEHSSTGEAAACMACSNASILAPLKLCSDCRGDPDSRKRQVEEDASAGDGSSDAMPAPRHPRKRRLVTTPVCGDHFLAFHGLGAEHADAAAPATSHAFDAMRTAKSVNAFDADDAECKAKEAMENAMCAEDALDELSAVCCVLRRRGRP